MVCHMTGSKKLVVEKWLVTILQPMYKNARSRVRVHRTFSGDFQVQVGLHRSSVLTPLLFTKVLGALSTKISPVVKKNYLMQMTWCLVKHLRDWIGD